jgi:hypothetical protein
MHRCNGRLFDGSACNNLTYGCTSCETSGCAGDGCDSQSFDGQHCDCGASLEVRAAAA